MRKQKYHIAIVEDDALLLKALHAYLTQHGYNVTVFDRGEGVASWVRNSTETPFGQVDVLVCDIGLPDIDGRDIINELSAFPKLGTVLISVRGCSASRVKGLLKGADDYLAKPINPQELLLRIQAIIRRIHGCLVSEPEVIEPDTISINQFTLHPESRIISCGETRQKLTDAENALLLVLLGKRGKAVSREELASRIGNHQLTGRSIDVLVGRLRRKLSDHAKHPECLVTVRGKGYMLVSQ